MRLPRSSVWAALASLLLGLALLVLVVRPQPDVGTLEPSTGPGVVAEFLGRQSSLLLVVSIVLSILALWAFRRFRFAQLTRRPGPVEVLPFVKEQDTEAPVEHIVAHFRKALRDVSLSPPMSMPGEPVSQDFLHVLRTATSQAPGAAGAVIGMLSALQVNGSYRVSGVLRRRETDPSCGLAVQIVVFPTSAGAVKTFWADDWLEVAELGAHFVGAYVLPRSKICARPPWTAWKGLPIPDELFHWYQVAQSMLRKEHYEEALDALYAALHRDPQNPYLRIQAAQLREQLGQQLDAVANYIDIIEIQAWQDRRLWNRLRRPDPLSESVLRSKLPGVWRILSRWRSDKSGWSFIGLRSHRNGREALLIARYRLVSALVRGSRLASQWYESDISDNPRRSEERTILRDRMRKWLTPRYHEFRALCAGQATSGGLPDDFEGFADNYPNWLPLLFQFVAVRETMDLIEDYSWFHGRRRPNMSIPQSALRVLGVWAALHLILVELRVSGQAGATIVRCNDRHIVSVREKLGLDGTGSSWPPDPGAVDLLISGALRWKPRAFRGWQENYNSASTFAVTLLHGKVDAEISERIATKAVRCLERAVLTIGSGLASQYSKWLAFGDQDMNALRGTDSFTDFNDRYFPRSELRKTTRSREILEQVLWTHIAGLIRQYAALRADFWESRAQHATGLLIAEEVQRERDIALIVGAYLKDYWSWQVRLRLIKEAQRFTHRLGDTSSFDSSFPSIDTVLGVAVEGMGGPSRATPHAVANGSNYVEPRRSGILSSEYVQDTGTSPPTMSGTNGRDRLRTEKERKRLSRLWRTIDEVLDAALRGDENAKRKLEISLRRVVSVAKRSGRPAGDDTHTDAAAAGT
ncbi:MAG: hypothetical protein ACRDSP_19035 [Pseudonocardiaceae bacterium]